MLRDSKNVAPSILRVTLTQRLGLSPQCISVPSFYCLSAWHRKVTITETLLYKRTWKKCSVILRAVLPLISTGKSNLIFNATFTACRLQHKCILGNMQCTYLHLWVSIFFFFRRYNFISLNVLAFSTYNFHLLRSWMQLVQFFIFSFFMSFLVIFSSVLSSPPLSY